MAVDGNESGMSLPAPAVEQLASQITPNQAPEVPNQRAEQAAVGAERAAAAEAAAGLAMPTIPQQAAPVVPAAPINDNVQHTTKTSVTNTTDDTDLIEKEWVNKAKAIVDHNREDPYQQSKQLTVVKADYMQQHYNKTIKTAE